MASVLQVEQMDTSQIRGRGLEDYPNVSLDSLAIHGVEPFLYHDCVLQGLLRFQGAKSMILGPEAVGNAPSCTFPADEVLRSLGDASHAMDDRSKEHEQDQTRRHPGHGDEEWRI